MFKVQLNIIRPNSCAECPLCRYQNKRYKSICPLTGAGKPYGKRSIACPLDSCGDDDTWEIVRYKGDIALYARCGCGYRYVCSTSERNEDGTWSSKQKVSMLHPYCPSCGAKKRYYSDNVKKVDSYPWEEEDGADNQVEESQY